MSGAWKEPLEPPGPAWAGARSALAAEHHFVRRFPTRLLCLPPLLAAEPTHAVQSLVLVASQVPYMTGEPKISVATSTVL